MVRQQMDSACPGSFVTGRFREPHPVTDLHRAERGIYQAVAVKMNIPSVRRLDDAVFFLWIDVTHPAEERLLVLLDLALLYAMEVLELAAHGIESVPYRYVGVLACFSMSVCKASVPAIR